jgi:AcrR family transcriptional regulator
MPRSSREKSEETYNTILEAAYRLFLECGYHGTSMRDVSQSAGLTVGAIYNHFPTKEDLWIEVILTKHPYREIFPLLRAAEGKTYTDLVRSAANSLVQELVKRPDLLNLMFIEIVEFKGSHVPILFEQIFPEAVQLRGILDIRHGHLRDIPIGTLLRSFVGLFFSYYVTGVLMNNQGGVTIDAQSLNQFVDLYLYGLLADDDPTRSHPKPA